jgi:PAS domain S-box-containing protein
VERIYRVQVERDQTRDPADNPVVKDQAPEHTNGINPVSLVKERLSELFHSVPGLLTAASIGEKLQRAAEALSGPHFFAGCSLYLEDPELGLLSVHAGAAATADTDLLEYYHNLRERLDWQADGNGDGGGAGSVAEKDRVLLALRNQEGRRIGLAELISTDESLREAEMLSLIQVFLMETAQSVEQCWLARELEKNEATYRSLVDNVSDVIFRVDREGKFTFVSRQVREMLGVEWREVRGVRVLDFVSPKDAVRVRNAYEDLLRGNSVRLDLQLIRPDRREVVVFVAVNPQLEAGTVVGALGVARDVTEKRRLEEQIAESERRYRALTENAYDAILLVDPETCEIMDVNPQAEKLTGYSRAELLNMSVLDLRRPDQAEEVYLRIAEVMKAGVGRFEDASLIAKDGGELQVDTAASVYELEGKRYYQAIIRDISEQKRMNEILGQRVMELQVLSEVSDALQSAVDLQSVMGIVLTGVTAGKGLGFNRAFILSYDKMNNELRGEAGLGPRSAEEAGRIWTNLEAKGLSLSEILDEMIRSFPEDADESFEFARTFAITLDDDQNAFAQAIRNRETLRVNLSEMEPHLPQDFLAVYTPHEFAIVPLVTRDDVMGVLLVDNLFTQRPIRDVDLHRLKLFANSAASAIERSRLLINLERRLHELMLANQDLKVSRDRLIKTERLSAIGEVAASVAHEIRNPLTAIGGFARAVYTTLSETDKNRRKIEVILEETDRLEHMLSSLLEFTRPAVPRFGELDLNGLIMQTVHFMGTEIDPNAVGVVYELDPNVPRVWADGQQIRQVLLNVIRNALQEMPNGGKLTFVTHASKNSVQAAVKDNGPGIAPEHLEKIFEAFFTTKPSGSGLGLAICAQIMRNHNGRLEVASRPTEGAMFILTLPIAQKGLDSY